jgi:hypothetical protein
LSWYTEEIEKKGGVWQSKPATNDKEKPTKNEAAASRLSTWQKAERDYIVECIATEANTDQAFKKVHERVRQFSSSPRISFGFDGFLTNLFLPFAFSFSR